MHDDEPVGIVTEEMEHLLKLVVENGGELLRVDDHFCAGGRKITTPEEIWKIIHTDWVEVDYSFFQVRIMLTQGGKEYYDGLKTRPSISH
ncbi:hypothetical protein [Bosea sp. NPDC055594]